MTKEELKQKLLDLKIFENNEYFNKYVEIVFENKDRKRKKKDKPFFDKHHIIPKYYFKDNNLEVDNSKENLVVLTLKEHILVHYYLYESSKGLKYKYYNLLALSVMIYGKKKYDKEWLLNEIHNNLDKLVEIREIYRQGSSLHSSGESNPMFGKKHSEHTRKLISQRQKEYQKNHQNNSKLQISRKHISESLMGHIVDDYTRNKIGNKLKNTLWISNHECEICVDKKYLDEFLQKYPDFHLGRLENNRVKADKSVRFCVVYKDSVRCVAHNLVDNYLNHGYTIYKKPSKF